MINPSCLQDYEKAQKIVRIRLKNAKHLFSVVRPFPSYYSKSKLPNHIIHLWLQQSRRSFNHRLANTRSKIFSIVSGVVALRTLGVTRAVQTQPNSVNHSFTIEIDDAEFALCLSSSSFVWPLFFQENKIWWADVITFLRCRIIQAVICYPRQSNTN